VARVPSLTAEDIPAEYQDEFERFTEAFARNPNLVPVYFHCPEMARFIFGMGAEFRAKEVLPPRLVEIIVVTVSKVNDCPYCTAHHSSRALDLGMDTETLENILEPDPPGLDEKEKLVRDYARLAIERPWGIRDKIYEDMKRHFSDRELVAITMRANLASLFNKINMALQIEMEDGVLENLLSQGLNPSHIPVPEAAK
jgi:AhpD family alkylhydroperoxidase